MPLSSTTESNFAQKVLKSSKPTLVGFWAKWCTPSKTLFPILEEIAATQNAVSVTIINVEEEQALAQSYHVQSLPTLLLFEGGQIKKSCVGSLSHSQIVSMLQD